MSEMPTPILKLTVLAGSTGLLFVTSDDPRGLLVARRTLVEALAAVPDALAELREAGAAMPNLANVKLP